MLDDGTWTYVDYKSTRRGQWPTTDHLKFLNKMARTYAHQESRYYHNTELKEAILKGIQH